MRILNTSVPAAPVINGDRVAALERVAQSIREKIRHLEERLQALEEASQSRRPASIPHTDVTLDAEAFKKNLLPKMWKYLHDDEQPAKTA